MPEGAKTPTTPAKSPKLPQRRGQIERQLRQLFSRMLGVEGPEIDGQATFLELGADSLLLLQTSQALKAEFGVRIPFRDLLETVSTIAALTDHLDQEMPAEALTEANAQAPAAPAASDSRPEPSAAAGPLNGPVASRSPDLQPAVGNERQAEGEWSGNGERLPVLQGHATQDLSEGELYEGDLVESESVSDGVLESILQNQLQILDRQLQVTSEQLDLLSRLGPGSLQADSRPQAESPARGPLAREQAPPPAAPSPQQKAQDHPGAGKGFEAKPYVAHKPAKTKSTGLNPRQQEYVDQLAERLGKRHRKSKELARHSRPVLADSRNSKGFQLGLKELLYPIFSDRASGARVWDIDGNQYLDLNMGYGTLVFGHSPPFVQEALACQSQTGLQIGLESPLASKAARLICELTGNERASFLNSGTEAVMAAIRLARTRTGRSKFVMFQGGYHGFQDEVLGLYGGMRQGRPFVFPMAPGVPSRTLENVMVLPYCSAESVDVIRECASELAAVILEPEQSRRPGMNTSEFIRELRKVTQESGTALILDEVVTGFRMHPGGVQALLDIRADIVTYGKAVGAGLPVGVVSGKAEYLDGLDGGMWDYGDDSYPRAESTFMAGTYFAHPLLMPAICAVLQEYKKRGPQLQEGLSQGTRKLAKRLNQYLTAEELPIRVICWGSMCGPIFGRRMKHPSLLYYSLLDQGLYVRDGRPWFISAAHSDEDLDEVFQAVQASVESLREGGFLDPPPRPQAPLQTSSPDRAKPDGPLERPPRAAEAVDQGLNRGDLQAGRYPATETQRELWTLAQLGKEASRAYNEGFRIRLRGHFKRGAFHRSVQQAIVRHEMLRASFSPLGDELKIADRLEVDVPLDDLSRLGADKRRQEAQRLAAQEAGRPFDLSQSPLLRLRLIRLGHDDHLLTLTLHHSVSDGPSNNLVLREIFHLYRAACRGQVGRLPEPTPFSRFVQWQKDRLQGAQAEQAEAFWAGQFADGAPVLELPCDRPRPPVMTYAGARRSMKVDAGLYSQVKKLSARQGTTPFTLLLAAFQALLHRLSGQDDIVCGANAGVQALLGSDPVGNCVNLLAFRSRLQEDPAFEDYLQGVKETFVQAYEFQNYPFSRLVRKLGIPPDLSRTPLVSAVINLEQGSSGEVKIGSLRAQIRPNPAPSARFDLFFDLLAGKDGIDLSCVYSTDLFDSTTIARWLIHFRMLLQGICLDCSQSISQLSMLTEAQQGQLLREWGGAHSAGWGGRCLPELFQNRAQSAPDAVAVSFKDQHLSCHQLDASANRIANHLRSLGGGDETRVGICARRCPEMLAGMLGILKAGGAYVPLDPAYPAQRLSLILEDSWAPLLLAQEDLYSRLPATAALALLLDADWDTVSQASSEAPPGGPQGDALAYVIYTSGSTAKPKGVMVTHQGLANYLIWCRKAYGLSPGCRSLLHSSISFDLSVTSLWAPLLAGGTVRLLPDGDEAEALGPEIGRQQGLSLLKITPSHLAVLGQELSAEGLPGRVETLVVGGEALRGRDLSWWRTQAPGARIVNEYGPTETVVGCCALHLSAQDRLPGGAVSIGRPAAGARLFILDGRLQVVAIGVAGQLHIAGPGVARGYQGDPGRSAAAFLPHPFAAKPGERIYASGDLARWLPDGTIEFLGRIDESQVKIRGFRIELSEIESTLKEHPSVLEAVTAVRGQEDGRKLLRAYLVCREGAKPPAQELRGFLGRQLPDYMIPAFFAFLDSLPLTPNGKVDRRALPADGEVQMAPGASYLAPRTPSQTELAQIWQQVLGCKRAGIEDNFFDLGGDSILGVQIVVRAAQAGLEFSLGQLFEMQTIRALTRLLEGPEEASSSRAPTESAAQIEEGDPRVCKPSDFPLSGLGQAELDRLWEELPPIEDLYPLAPLQKGLLFHALHQPESSHYVQQFNCLLRGRLDVRLLQRAWKEIASRHAALRTVILWEGLEEPLQAVLKAAQVQWEVEDWSKLDADEQKLRMGRFLATDARRGFDLSETPASRLALFRLAEDSSWLVWSHHHMLLDGWSISILLAEFLAAYQALKAGRRPELPEVRPFREYLAWIEQQGLAEAEDFWRKMLAGFEAPTPLGFGRIREAPPPSMSHGSKNVRLSEEETAALVELSRRGRVTLNTLMLGAWALLQSRCSGSRDVVFGVTSSGRHAPLPGVESMVGLFINTLPLRVQIESRQTSLLPWLQQLQKLQVEMLSHSHIPLFQVHRWSDVPAGQPLFEAMLASEGFQRTAPNRKKTESAGQDLDLRSSAMAVSGVTHFPLTLVDTPGRCLCLEAGFDRCRFDGLEVERMLRHLKSLLSGMTTGLEQPLSHLSLLTAAERHQMVVEWAGSAVELPAEPTMTELIEQQSARTPERVCIVIEAPHSPPDLMGGAVFRHLSYGELDLRAQQLAGHLERQGVGPEVPVGLCLDRCVEMMVAFVGIFKAGAAYVPLDPTYPPERLSFLLQDTHPQLVLTRKGLTGRLADRTPVLRLDSDWPRIAQQAGPSWQVRVFGESLLYVMHTSGSTGRPKGVALSHQGICNRLLWQQGVFGLSCRDRVLQKTPFTFDVSVWEFFWPLICGACLVMARPEGHKEPEYLNRLIHLQGVTLLHFVPSMLKAYMDFPDLEDRKSVARVLCSGEALPVQLQNRFLSRFDCRLHNIYGPTEASIGVSLWHCRPDEKLPSVPIGRAIQNNRLVVLDDQLRLLPMGVSGELHLGGISLARGYWGQPGLTAAQFVPDPVGPWPGARLYRSGDRARLMPDGNIEYLGRLDFQVKIRGFRIELGEIEAVLCRHPAVKEAVAVARAENEGDARLIAYTILHTDHAEPQEGWESALRRFLRDRLPSHMEPSAIALLKSLPLTPSGKLDRSALPSPGQQPSEAAGVPAAPRTSSEALLLKIWKDVLQQEQLGLHDNFFDSGGDSILAIQIVARSHQAGLRVSTRQIFDHQTIAGLAAAADEAAPPEETPQAQAPVTGPVPLTPIQMWFFEHDPADLHHFNQSSLLETDLEANLLEKAVQLLWHHHDALRLRFALWPNGWRQFNAGIEPQTRDPSRNPSAGEEEALVFFHRLDLSALSPRPRRQRSILEAAAQQLQGSLSLSSGPLLRCAHFRMGAGMPGRLLIVMHHLAVDGVSWRILLEDLQTACRQLSRREEPRLPPKSTSFRDWAHLVTDCAGSQDLQEEAEFWLSQSERPTVTLPEDFPEGRNVESSLGEVSLALSRQETRLLLQEVPRAYHTQINDVLLTALVQALVRWAGPGCFCIDLEGHGREGQLVGDVDLSRTVGWFTSLYPVWLELEEVPRSASQQGPALKSIQNQLKRIPNRGIGYGLLRYLGRDPSVAQRLASQPRPQIVFNYWGQVDQSGAQSPSAAASSAPLLWGAQESPGTEHSPRALRSHQLEAGAIVLGGRLRIRWQFSSNLHRRSTIDRLGQDFMQALRSLIEHCGAPSAQSGTPSDFPLAKLDEPELTRLLAKLPEIEDLYPLSPLQQGMLFHSLSEPERGEYIEQLSWRLVGQLDRELLQQAWEETARRHPVLRSIFVWEDLEEPLQAVCKKARFNWEFADWTGLGKEEQRRRLSEFLAGERRRGFEYSQAPPQRWAVFRLAEDSHQVVWTHHHVLLDGWSVRLLLPEFLGTCRALAQGRRPDLPPVPPYRDYIAHLCRQDLSRAEAFWRRKLSGYSEPTPVDLGRPLRELPADEDAYRWNALALTEGHTRSLKSLARQGRLTLNTLVQAAWALLLNRYSGCREVVFGVTLSGRPAELKGVESMIGLFINTLPLRVGVEESQLLGQWLQTLQAAQLELLENAYSPLVKIRQWSEVPADRPLFESMLAYQNYPGLAASARQKDSKSPSSLRLEDFAFQERTNFPLTLVVAPAARLFLRLAVDRRRFTDCEARRMLHQLKTILESMTAESELRVGDLRVLTAAEKQMLLECNDRGRRLPDGCLHQFVEAQAALRPEAVSALIEDHHLSFAELGARADRLARTLANLGAGPETPVGLRIERSSGLVIGLLGILKTGAAYLPLDPDYPQQRLEFMLKDARASLLVSNRRVPPGLAGGRVRRIDIEEIENASVGGEEPLACNPVNALNTAYVIYTSGSTGRPKGVAVSHQAICNHMLWMQHRYPLTLSDSVLQRTSFSFDASIWEFFAPLMQGARLVIAKPASPLDSEYLTGLIERGDATVLQVVPSMLRILLEGRRFIGSRGLRMLYSGGEALTADLRDKLLARMERLQMVNVYGPTEAAIQCASWDCDQPSSGRTVPIGRPVFNTAIHLLDRYLRPVCWGAAGELCIGGRMLARGYLHRPGLTAERFVPDHLGSHSGQRLYRSGDLARRRFEGSLEFIRRLDNQVKLRGFRIELGEIEAALRDCPQVRAAAVTVRADSSGSGRLVAYYAPRKCPPGQQGGSPQARQANRGLPVETAGHRPADADEIRSFLEERLPSFMMPSFYIPLDRLPLTVNGKLDREALPAPEEVAGKQRHAPLRGAVESSLVQIWKRVLGIGHIEPHDSFFRLGGHSLLATRVIALVRQSLGVSLPIRALFDAPTVSSFAKKIAEVDPAQAPPPIIAVPREGELPLSFAQQRLWVLDRLTPGNPFYNIASAWSLSGRLELPLLQASLNQIIRRHEVLRSRFPSRLGQSYLEHCPLRELPMAVIDLTGLEEPVREQEAHRARVIQGRRPFDLARGPLIRASLLLMRQEKALLLVTMHHIVSDGWSMGIFLRELTGLYEAALAGRPSPLHPLPIQYADFAVWQRRWLQGEVLQRQLSYWGERLAGIPHLDLPTDRPRPAIQAFRAGYQSFQVSSGTLERLRALGQQHGATLFMTLLAAYQSLLHRYTSLRLIVVGSPIANRNYAGTEGLIGFFINTLSMVADFSGHPSFAQLLDQVSASALDAYTHQDLPFEKLVDHLQIERNLNRNPIFQVVMVLQELSGEVMSRGGLNIRPVSSESRTTRFDLEAHFWEHPEGLGAVLIYDLDLFDSATLKRLAGHFVNLLEAAVQRPSERVIELPMLGSQEKRQLMVTWNDVQAEYDRDLCLHEPFQRQAERTPDALAAVFEEQALSYGELRDWTNRLAHLLIQLGVAPGGRVGVCIERSLEMVAALIAVLKAGGAYVPIDPEWPRQRIEFILQDVGASVLLTRCSISSSLQESAALAIDLGEERLEGCSSQDPPRRSGPENLAYIIFTSGSTGLPKGVVLRHSPVINLIDWVNSTFGVDGADRVLLVASMCFDLSVYDIFGILAAGGSIYVASESEVQDARKLASLLDSGAISFWDSAPAALQQLVPFLPSAGQGNRRLRLAFLSGDWIPLPLPPAVSGAFPGLQVVGLGGATEAAIWSNYHVIDQIRPEWTSIPYGRAIQNARYFVLDEAWQPAATGVAGGLCIGGECLSSGYWNQSRLTAEKYLPDPFSGRPGAVLYSTGDQARWRPAGYIEFLGRLDTQVKIRGYRIELGEIQATLCEHPGVEAAVAAVREGQPGVRRLVAYAVAKQPSQAPAPEELREFARDKLPAYMIPSDLILLDAIPLTPNGKVDHQQLPTPQSGPSGQTYLAARTPTESILVQIWQDVLGLEQIGIEDNFFDSGGDSILSIQIVARANQAGLGLAQRHIFEHQTIAELAAVAGSAPHIEAEQGLVEGELPLTPPQHWLLGQGLANPGHFNQSNLLQLASPLSPGLLRRAAEHLLAHHDALRLRFQRQGAGWLQRNAGMEGEVPFSQVDLSGLGQSRRRVAFSSALPTLHSSLVLGTGPLVRMALFTSGRAGKSRFFMAVHHLAIDGVSWRILVEDLETACRQLLEGREVELPPKTTSYKDWASRLSSYARSASFAAEASYWRPGNFRGASPLPLDFPAGQNTEASVQTISVSLSRQATRALLSEIPQVYRTRINDLLLAALWRAFQSWAGWDSLLVDLEGHGREEFLEGIDLSRTVGWFTSIFPVVLRLESPPAGNAGLGATIKSIKEQLRRIPGQGAGYGLMRWLGSDRAIAQGLARLPQSQVSFNYLGQIDAQSRKASSTSEAAAGKKRAPLFHSLGAAGPNQAPGNRRRYMVDVLASVSGERLQVNWNFSRNLHRRQNIERLARGFLEALQALIAHCQSPDAGGFTPSDFPLARLSQQRLDQLLAHHQLIADLYPLSPMQHDILVHSLAVPASDLGILQFTYRLKGNVDPSLLKKVWQKVFERYTILRTGFLYRGLVQPLQFVKQRVELPWQEHDWADLPADQQRDRLHALLQEDRAKGFDPASVPLSRFALIRLNKEDWVFNWSTHHVLLDGWSYSLIMQEAATIQAALMRGREAPTEAARPYRDYIAWLESQDLAEAESYWRRTMKGLASPTPLWIGESPSESGEEGFGNQEMALSAETAQALQQLAQRERITLNTLLQAAWALLLHRCSGESDVVLGVTVSGRSGDLEGIDSMLGLFINNLPMRIKATPQLPLARWLQEIQQQQLQLNRYEYIPQSKIQQWSDLPGAVPAYESVVVFENYPWQQPAPGEEMKGQPEQAPDRGRKGADRSEMRLVHHYGTRTSSPLTVLSAPQAHFPVSLIHDRRRFSSAAAARILRQLKALLGGFAVAAPDACLGDVNLLSPAQRGQLLESSTAVPAVPAEESCLHHMFDERARRMPEAIGVDFGGECITFGQLQRSSSRVAAKLIQAGAGPDCPVGLCLEEGISALIGSLGILKAGAYCSLLPPSGSAERVDRFLRRQPALLVLTDQKPSGRLSGQRCLPLLGECKKNLSVGEAALPSPPVEPANLAIAVRTPGEGAQALQISHGSLTRTVGRIRHHLDLGEGQWFVAASGLADGFGIVAILLALSSGSRLAVTDLKAFRSTKVRLLPEGGAQAVVHATASGWRKLLKSGWKGGPQLRLLCSGEALSRGLASRLLQNCDQLTSLYGELSDAIWHYPIKITAQGSTLRTCPIAANPAWLLDRELQPMPAGIAAELHIGGEHLPRCLAGEPGATALHFVPDPWSGKPGARLFRSGVLARRLEEGRLEILGRQEGAVRVGGRIAYPEVTENTLKQHPALISAVTVAHQERPGESKLAAYLGCAQNKEASSVESLRAFLKQRLPWHMLPGEIAWAESLPETSSGEFDREALSRFGTAHFAERGSAFTRKLLFQDSLEAQLLQIWQEVFDRRDISVGDSFFDLGGSSVLAVSLIAKIQQRIGLDLPLATLLSGTTLQKQADLLREQSQAFSWSPLVRIKPEGSHQPFFAIHAAGGNVVGFYELARHLEREQPFYALQSVGLDGRQQPITDIRQMASRYIREIQQVQPQGPYRLAGLSFGGFVAFEMACQLSEQGQETSFLAVFDTASPIYRGKIMLPQLAEDASATLASFASSTMRAYGSQSGLSAQDIRSVAPGERLDFTLEYIRQAGVEPEVGFEQIRRILRIQLAANAALGSYRPRNYSGRLTIFRCATWNQMPDNDYPATNKPELYEDWAYVCPQLEIIDVPGNHVSMMLQPHVRTLARHLSACLNRRAEDG